jgi:hypothetical protein
LSFNFTNRFSIPIRQPGEYRNLRMSHSVGYEKLFPLGIVGHWMRVTDA